jgi:hypothetical protein
MDVDSMVVQFGPGLYSSTCEQFVQAVDSRRQIVPGSATLADPSACLAERRSSAAAEMCIRRLRAVLSMVDKSNARSC